MAELTITEALAEIKTIGKRLDKKREYVLNYLLRQEALKDPLESAGGSVKAIDQTRQGIRDLTERLITIRAAVQRANQSNELEILGTSRTVQDWLTWRKEVAPVNQSFMTRIRTTIDQTRNQQRTRGNAVVAATATAEKPTDVLVNLDEVELAKDAETLEEVLGALDGRLSLFNATCKINIAD